MPTSFEAALGADAPNTPATGFAVAMGGWAHGSIGTAGDADFIVTRNLRDLRGAELRFRSLQVLSPEDFLKEL